MKHAARSPDDDYERAYRNGDDELPGFEEVPFVEVGEIDSQGRRVYSDGVEMRPLTPERRQDLDQQWFGPYAKDLDDYEPKANSQRLMVSCDGCGKTMALTAEKLREKRRRSPTGRVYCSLNCSWQGNRKQRKADGE